ncbi:MAG: porin [Methylotenera sp.]|nr:porin [Methylotenera sp.]
MNFKLKNLVAATLAGSFLMGFGANAMADTTDDIVNALIAKGVLTEEEGALLQRGRTGEKEAADKKKESAVSAKYKDGLSFESGDGKFKAAINGRVHTDYRIFDYNEGKNNASILAATTNSIPTTATQNQSQLSDGFELRRARLGFKASWKDYYEGEVVTDLTDGSALIDVGYVNIAWWKPVQFRVGIFKMPMNLEELTSSNNIDFMERSFVNGLAPAKEIGAMVHGSPFTGVTYALALSNGNGKTRETELREDGKDVIGRVTANFAEIMGNKTAVYHVGASFSQGDQYLSSAAGTAIGFGSARTEGRGATFMTGPSLTGGTNRELDRSRVGLEGAVAYGPFKAQAEWMKLSNEFATTVRSYDLDTSNWYAEALWTITGENYADAYKGGAFGSLKPKNDFDPSGFKGGLWEVGVRFSQFDASDYNTTAMGQGVVGGLADAGVTTKARGFAKADAWTLGLKFLPTANTRLMLNYVNTNFNDVIGGATGGLVINNERVDSEKALNMRAQWMF